MFWDKTITLYNKFEEEKSGKVTWHRHRIEECFFKDSQSLSSGGNVRKKSSEGIARIPEQTDYVSPSEWLKLSEQDRAKVFTLQVGDIIISGDVSDDIDEYTKGMRSSDLIAKYISLGVLSIKTVNVNTFAPGAHYFIRGE